MLYSYYSLPLLILLRFQHNFVLIFPFSLRSYHLGIKLSIKISAQKLSSLKSLIIPPPPLITRECAMKTSEMALLSNSKWQTRKERPYRSTNNGDMAEKAKRPVGE